MAKVILRSDEPLRNALKRFKKLCDKEGIITRTKRNSRYEKRSEERRRQENERIKTIRKAQRESP